MYFGFKKLVIILPTFNESQNVHVLLRKITVEVPHAYVVIIDDSNTIENRKIKKLVKRFDNVEIISRQKKLGRGSAVLEGFAYALKNKKLEYFVEMDTDLAHDPSELKLLQKVMRNNDADLVIGSRYLQQSKIIDWPLRRLLMSRIINFFLNLWLGLNLHDYTNGYRLYRRKAVEYLVKKGIKEKNFIALSESAFLLKNNNYIIVEVPISFTDRKHGESSVGLKELCMCLVGALRIRFRRVFDH